MHNPNTRTKTCRLRPFEFTFVNKFSLERSPYVYVYAENMTIAQRKVEKYFPKSYWSLESVMGVQRDVVFVSQFRLVEPLIFVD